MLEIKNLKVAISNDKNSEKKEILHNLSLPIHDGEVHAIMGPNGSGKSSLTLTIMGHPRFEVQSGEILFDGKDVISLPVHERARLGIFLAFQTPYEIEGVTLRDFLYQAYKAQPKNADKSMSDFESILVDKIRLLGMKPEFVERSLNVGFSGGEKKRAEILQMAVLNPKLVILDEIDSGLDIDALKVICDGILEIKKSNPKMALIIITHYPRILRYLVPNKVHILAHGSIVQSGSKELADRIEAEGYDKE